MVELGVELHPEAFHHGAGVQVDDGGECHKLMEVELCEAERDGLLCGLRGIAQAPIWFRQAPADRGRTEGRPMEHASRQSR